MTQTGISKTDILRFPPLRSPSIHLHLRITQPPGSPHRLDTNQDNSPSPQITEQRTQAHVPLPAMSMGRLSTELDDIIIQQLAQPELAAISRTSKYYHALAEPYLYKDLVLLSNVDFMRLMLTVLKRRNLCQYIRSITLVTDRWKKLYMAQFRKANFGKVAEIRNIIQQVALPLHDNTFTRCWLDQILHTDSDRYTEGAPALLLTLSTKLEYLDLGLMELGLNLSIVSIVRRVLSAHWQKPDDNKADCPFSKLKELNMNTNGRRVLVLPSMTTIRADGLYGLYTDDMFRTPYGFQNSFANLRVLKFEYMEIAPASVGGLLPIFVSLSSSGFVTYTITYTPRPGRSTTSNCLAKHYWIVFLILRSSNGQVTIGWRCIKS
jgi:hypothetical protein